MAKNGISPYPGPGGAGSGSGGTPAIPVVSVKGGTTTSASVTLPSFGSGSNQSNAPGRSSSNERRGPGITIEASPRSGGAFNYYGRLKGYKIYTIYIATGLGPAVFEYADSTSAAARYAGDLSTVEPIRTELPPNLRRSHLVITCVLDRSGGLKNLQVLESSASELTRQVMAALPSWKFRPAMRGDQPVEVNAILGFGVDTNDRF
jgi:TonB family protein